MRRALGRTRPAKPKNDGRRGPLTGLRHQEHRRCALKGLSRYRRRGGLAGPRAGAETMTVMTFQVGTAAYRWNSTDRYGLRAPTPTSLELQEPERNLAASRARRLPYAREHSLISRTRSTGAGAGVRSTTHVSCGRSWRSRTSISPRALGPSSSATAGRNGTAEERAPTRFEISTTCVPGAVATPAFEVHTGGLNSRRTSTRRFPARPRALPEVGFRDYTPALPTRVARPGRHGRRHATPRM